MASSLSLSSRTRPTSCGSARLPTSRAMRIMAPARCALRVQAFGKKDLVEKVAAETGLTQEVCAQVVAATLDAVKETVVSGEKVSILGFGSFQGKDRKARTGRNPKTGEELQIAATRAPTFTPAKAFKDALKQEFINNPPK